MDADRAAAEAAKPPRDQVWWLAESPTIPGYYLRAKARRFGKLGEQEELARRMPWRLPRLPPGRAVKPSAKTTLIPSGCRWSMPSSTKNMNLTPDDQKCLNQPSESREPK